MSAPQTDVHTAHEDEIRRLVTRLGRPHPSGGTVVERAAIMAAGVDFGATIAWIVAHGGQPEARPVVAAGRGLHSARADGGGAGSQTPRRFVLPADATS